MRNLKWKTQTIGTILRIWTAWTFLLRFMTFPNLWHPAIHESISKGRRFPKTDKQSWKSHLAKMKFKKLFKRWEIILAPCTSQPAWYFSFVRFFFEIHSWSRNNINKIMPKEKGTACVYKKKEKGGRRVASLRCGKSKSLFRDRTTRRIEKET